MALRLELQEPQGLPGQVERWGIHANPLNGGDRGRIVFPVAEDGRYRS